LDPETSGGSCTLCVVDAGVIKLLPPLVKLLEGEAPHVRLNAVQFDAEHLDSWLETGTIDFAMGSFSHLTKGIRRQPLWIERYVSLVRKPYPRLTVEPSIKAFAD